MLVRLLIAASIALTTPAHALIVDFVGTRENVGPGTAPGTGRCVPPYFSTTVITPGNFSSTGTSNFGPFTATLSHCNLGPTPTTVVDGLALLEFAAGDSLSASYTGLTALTDVPGVFSSQQEWTVTGGTGRFLDAKGHISHLGSLSVGVVNGVRSGIYVGSFEGRVSVVPEPATWATLILGLGLIGVGTSRRSSTSRLRVADAIVDHEVAD